MGWRQSLCHNKRFKLHLVMMIKLMRAQVIGMTLLIALIGQRASDRQTDKHTHMFGIIYQVMMTIWYTNGHFYSDLR